MHERVLDDVENDVHRGIFVERDIDPRCPAKIEACTGMRYGGLKGSHGATSDRSKIATRIGEMERAAIQQ